MVNITFTDGGLPLHLGGHENETHIDEGALDYLIKNLGITSMLDIGCGPGGMVELALDKNLKVLGVDGDFVVERSPRVKDHIKIHDYTTGVFPDIQNQTFDLGWCVEFVEHLDAQYIYNFADSFRKCKYIVMTHALPGQPGHHHVNCQPIEYWVAVMTAFGLIPDVNLTNEVRQASTMGERYIRQQSLVLRNNNFAEG